MSLFYLSLSIAIYLSLSSGLLLLTLPNLYLILYIVSIEGEAVHQKTRYKEISI